MARHKDIDWNMPEGQNNGVGGKVYDWDTIKISLMMDIRDELKRINLAVNRINPIANSTGFLMIPHKLDEIRRQTQRMANRMKRKAKVGK